MTVARRWITLGLVLVLGSALFFVYVLRPRISDTPTVLPVSRTEVTPVATTTPDTSFVFEIKDTDAERQLGLSGRLEVPPNYGMLFVFEHAERYGMWMKDMYVPIDIIWLSDTGVIIGIEESISPDTYPTVFYAPQPVRFVLETRAGEARAQGWSIGTQVPLPEEVLAE